MASSDSGAGGKIQEAFRGLSDSLNEQQWFQELKAKWEELDPQSRTYLKFATGGAALLLFLITVLSFVWSVHSLKRELSEKNDLLHLIQSSNDELRRLKDSAPAQGQGDAAKGDANWNGYFEATASSLGIEKNALTIAALDKAADKPGDLAKESLYDVQVKHVSVKQVIRYAYALEHGNKPVKVRNLFVDTGADPAGYMDAKLSVSAFTLAAPTK